MIIRLTDENKYRMLQDIETFDSRFKEWTERATEFCLRDPVKAIILMAQNLRQYPLINLRNLPITNLRNYPILGGEGAPFVGGDPLFESVVLLLGFEGDDGDTATTDESNSSHAITFIGTAQLDTAVKKFGDSSLLLDGNSDNLTAADDADFLLDGEFTIEAFVRINGNLVPNQVIVSQWVASGNQRAWAMVINDNSNQLRFGWSANGTDNNVIVKTAAISTGTWFHMAVTRDSDDDIRLFLDGTALGSPNNVSTGLNNSTAPVCIGCLNTSVDRFHGWIDELRITKGDARYTANFTPPTEAFPRD